MQIIILKNGKYNNASHKFQECQEGDIFDIGARYGNTLIENGLAKLASEKEVEIAEEEQALVPDEELVELEPEILTRVAGVTKETQTHLYEAGIDSIELLRHAVYDGTVVNVPTIGLKRRETMKEWFDAQ